MSYWFLCVPFTRAFVHPEESSIKAEEKTFQWRAFLIFCDFIGSMVLLWIVGVLQFMLLTTLFLSGGHFRGTGGWFLNAFLSATIIILIPTSISFGLWLKRKPKPTSPPLKPSIEMETMSSVDLSSVKIDDLVVDVHSAENQDEVNPSFARQCCLMRLLPFYIFVILCSEIALIFVHPFNSIFPIGIASDEVVIPLEGEFIRSKHCPNCPEDCPNIDEEVRKAREFFKHSLIDFSKVHIAYGGLPGHFNTAPAMVFDQGVYLAFDTCPRADLFVHEFVHIWQGQSGWWFENGVSKYIQYEIEKYECDDELYVDDCLYDYGGMEGLRKAAADPHATITSSFFVEEQASIVEDYFRCIHDIYNWYDINGPCSPEYHQLLMQFSADVLYDNNKLSKKPCEAEDLILSLIQSEDCPSEVLSGIEKSNLWWNWDHEHAKIGESHTDGVYGNRFYFSGCSTVYLDMQLKEGISSGFCECNETDDLCTLPLIDAENQKPYNCKVYHIFQWSCPNQS